jgi:hypothetical protein
LKAFHDKVLLEILDEKFVSSRNRHNPRGVKRKLSNLSPAFPRHQIAASSRFSARHQDH